jgi:hypothetical protein
MASNVSLTHIIRCTKNEIAHRLLLNMDLGSLLCRVG